MLEGRPKQAFKAWLTDRPQASRKLLGKVSLLRPPRHIQRTHGGQNRLAGWQVHERRRTLEIVHFAQWLKEDPHSITGPTMGSLSSDFSGDQIDVSLGYTPNGRQAFHPWPDLSNMPQAAPGYPQARTYRRPMHPKPDLALALTEC